MHEISLAVSIVKFIEDVMKKEGIKKIKKVNIVLGELQNIDTTILSETIEEMFRQEKLGNVKVKIRIEKTVVLCKNCGHKFLAKMKFGKKRKEMIHFLPEIFFSFISCKKCGSKDIEFKCGRDVRVESIEY